MKMMMATRFEFAIQLKAAEAAPWSNISSTNKFKQEPVDLAASESLA